ncbi:MAG: 4-hydroxythreonine-4-phosphate dehydrogenase PdxA [Rhodospirillales bacterium]|nr:4-hydroxythreonine-4-phosphate dehydrogenase PdxA [Rhodospirillales bacterium]MBO6786250.1 4-hydroxythreonine-4-phosphate dehydrogenase PdxA [Rhodospirillales bacterium]
MPPPAPNVVTMGEPAGIGGELTVRAWAHHRAQLQPFFALDDPVRLSEAAKACRLTIDIAVIDEPAGAIDAFKDALPIIPLTADTKATMGKPGTSTAKAVLESIERAVAYTTGGDAAAMVTNPIQKETLYDAGFGFPGHTEYLADLVGGGMRPVMMLAGPSLKVVPLTVHVPLRKALDQLTTDAIVEQGTLVVDALRYDYGIDRPRLAVAGLNPHAGENGKLGNEEIDIIIPAAAALKETGAEIIGPIPPDALFTPRARTRYDAALCMYHDQALIPVKALDFDHAVNVTLGLPIVRTSPDHGTALDIAGKGLADPSSLVSALKMATEISACRQARRAG